MRTAHPRGLTPDGRNLIVVIEGGEEVAIPADERLKAALRNDRARIGQLEIDMESALRPRDIQARVRAGESLEAVAQAAGVPIAKIEPFAGPVLAEREHVAGLAQANPVRRTGDAVAHRSLRAVVADRLLPQGVDPDAVEWDAWRSEDRRWTVLLSYQLDSADRRAEFSYDQTGRFSTASNDEARWLTGEQSEAQCQQAHDGTGHHRSDELAIVRAIQPQFAVTPDIDEPLEDEADDGSSDNEDAFAEGDLAEVDGVYDIVPGDGSSMDVLYDMLSTFDEDSVQIYAGLVRPRPEQSAAPVLPEGPATSEFLAVEFDIELSASEPSERPAGDGHHDGEAADEPVYTPPEAEQAVAEPEASLVDLDAAAPQGEATQHEPEPESAPTEPSTEQAGTPTDAAFTEPADDLAEPEAAAEVEPVDTSSPETASEADDEPIVEPAAGAASAEEPASADEAGAAPAEEPVSAEEPAAASGEGPADEESARAPRPGQIKPSPAEPEQPSLVDAAGNEPSRSIRRKRASVPSWDEIMFGAPRPKE